MSNQRPRTTMRSHVVSSPAGPSPDFGRSAVAAAFQPVWPWLYALWGGLWLLACLTGPWWLQVVGVELNAHGHTTLYAHGHPFIDARSWWGVPNTLDVLSNLPLLLAGGWGLVALARGCTDLSHTSWQALRFVFAGLALAGLGSAWYHWMPSPATLVADRLGMAVIFAGVLTLAACEKLGYQAGRSVLWLSLTMGLAGAVLPWSHDNPMPWVVLQFGGMVAVALLALRPALPDALGFRLGLLVLIYGLAKLLEWQDASLYHWTGGLVAGHSLKHLVAALAVWPLLNALRGSGKMQNTKSPCPVFAQQQEENRP